MNFIIKSITLLFIIFMSSISTLKSQVTIGSGLKPLEGAILDIKEKDAPEGGATADKGLLLPRVLLSKKNSLYPMFGSEASPTGDYASQKATIDQSHTGLMVYNLTTDLAEGLCPGVYVWKSSVWERLPKPCNSNPDPEADPLNSPNSYIVAQEGSVEIPVGKPYLLAKSRPTDAPSISSTDKVTPELLWQDAQGLITGVSLVDGDKGAFSTIKVQTNNAAGNALVAVRIGPTGTSADPIAWSWHIWVTDYNPDSQGSTNTINNGTSDFVFMDRNLGAINVPPADGTTPLSVLPGAIGLTYQWGRKDPFSPAQNIGRTSAYRTLYSQGGNALLEDGSSTASGIKHDLAINSSTDANNLKRSIQNPMTFFYGGEDANNSPIDWFMNSSSSQSDNSLWGTNDEKSYFDPCPKGWKVPSYINGTSPWVGYLGNTDDANGGTNAITNPYLEIFKQVGGKEDQNPYINNMIKLLSKDGNSSVVSYYPMAYERNPRTISNSGTTYLGGSFFKNRVKNGLEPAQFSLWTAESGSGSENASTAKLFYGSTGIGFDVTSPYEQAPVFPFPAIPPGSGPGSPAVGNFNTIGTVMADSSKATGSFVRCVKDSNQNRDY